MAVIHLSEAELLNKIAEVMRKVRLGEEFVIEEGNRPVAVIKPSKPGGRMISDVIAELKARGSKAIMDDEFADDIEEGITAQRRPWNPPPGISASCVLIAAERRRVSPETRARINRVR